VADFALLAATVKAIRASSLLPSPAIPSNTPAPSVSVRKPLNAPSAAGAPAGFASLIVADFPVLFAELRGKRFALLWRGSRDGFGARDFHRRCDGHAPTLTLIQDTAVEREARIRGQPREGRSESEEFSFYAEESAQFPGEEICADGRREGQINLL
jgi:hypothetical protein